MNWRDLAAVCVVCGCIAWCAWLGLQWQESRERERVWVVMGQCYEAVCKMECGNINEEVGE